MKTRYQVFVSSTFEDLKAERDEVMRALMELDCIPAGMELFPASDDEQWSYIKRVIDESDYYLLIVAGKYGSIEPSSGASYTELEYRHAVAAGKPIMSFVLNKSVKLTEDRIEIDANKRERLKAFVSTVTSNRLCKFWDSTSDLGAKVSRGVTQLIKQRPGTGWIRASEADKVNIEEVLRLRNRVLELEKELSDQVRQAQAFAISDLREDMMVNVSYSIFERVVLGDQTNEVGTLHQSRVIGEFSASVAWNVIISAVAPQLVGPSKPHKVLSAIQRNLPTHMLSKSHPEYLESDKYFLDIDQKIITTVRTLLVAAGLITIEHVDKIQSQRAFSGVLKGINTTPRIETRTEEYWKPTSEGSRYFANHAARAFL